jgi:hypothetical protein
MQYESQPEVNITAWLLTQCGVCLALCCLELPPANLLSARRNKVSLRKRHLGLGRIQAAPQLTQLWLGRLALQLNGL